MSKVTPERTFITPSPSSFQLPFTPFLPRPTDMQPRDMVSIFLRDQSFLLQDLSHGHLFPYCAFPSFGSLLVCCHLQGSFPPHVDRLPPLITWIVCFVFFAGPFHNDNLHLRAFDLIAWSSRVRVLFVLFNILSPTPMPLFGTTNIH